MNTLPMSRVCHNRSFWGKLILTLALKTKDMCHGTINSLVIPMIEVGDLGLISM